MQPPAYTRQKDFTEDFGSETDHSSLNAEFDDASNSINDIRDNLAILQADDGKLRPEVVTVDSIHPTLFAAIIGQVELDATQLLNDATAAAQTAITNAGQAQGSAEAANTSKSEAEQAANDAQVAAAQALAAIGQPADGTVTDAKLASSNSVLEAILGKLKFQAAGSAVYRSLRDKLRDAISVKDFGAKGDGVTNDAAAVQAAANAAAGKVLFFPAGEYVVNDGFDLSGDNSHIVGYGATLIYNQTTQTYNHCVRLFGNDSSVSGIKIQSPGVLVRDNTGFGISIGSTVTQTENVTVRDVTIDSVASAGIWFSNVRMAKAIGNTVRSCKADGIHFSDGCFDPIISNNILYNNGDDAIAVVNDQTGLPVTGNAVITGNIIEGGTAVGSSAGHGIALIGVAGGNISGNYIINTIEPGIGTYHWTDGSNPADDLVIEGNTLHNTGSGGTVFGGCGINLQETGTATIRGNTVKNLAYDGAKTCGAIRCYSATELVIADNNLYDNACDGIVVTVASTALTVKGNVFGFTARTPVLVSGNVGLCTVSGNAFNSTSGANDIDVNLPAAPVYVSGNRCGKAVSVVSNLTNNFGISRDELESFTPVVSAQIPAITTATASMSYQRKGRFIEVNIIVTITTNGTGAGYIGLTLPFSVINSVISGREVNISGAQVTGFATGSQIQIRKYDNSYPGANGAVIVLSGVIQLA